MPWQYYNPNPKDNLVGDCVIRALTLALNEDCRPRETARCGTD